MGFAVSFDAPNPLEPATTALSVGLWGLAGVLSVATAITLVAAVARQTAAGDGERRALAGLGFDRAALLSSASKIHGVSSAVVGSIGAVVVAAGLSMVHLLGVARTIEPEPGFDLDLTEYVLAVGAAATFTYVALISVLVGWRAASRKAPARRLATGRGSRAGRPPGPHRCTPVGGHGRGLRPGPRSRRGRCDPRPASPLRGSSPAPPACSPSSSSVSASGRRTTSRRSTAGVTGTPASRSTKPRRSKIPS